MEDKKIWDIPLDIWMSSFTMALVFTYLAVDPSPNPFLVFGLMVVGLVKWTTGVIKL